VCCSCGFYAGINGKVLDNVTGQPLEGALVVVQWSKTRGIPGLQYSDLHKIAETQTDKDGMFYMDGAFAFLLEPPIMLIYKEGYFPWRNDMEFPGGNITKDHEWKHNATYKLNILMDKQDYLRLHSFMDYGMGGNHGKEVPITSNVMNRILVKETAEKRKQMEKDKEQGTVREDTK
jgi:hypothetical protein